MFRWGHQVFLGWWAVCVNFEPDFGKHVSFRLAWLWLLTLNYPGRFIVSLRRYLTLLIPSRSWNVQRLLGLLLLNFGDVNWFVLGAHLLDILCFPSEPRGFGFLVDFAPLRRLGQKRFDEERQDLLRFLEPWVLVQQKGWQRGGSPGVNRPVFVQMIYIDVNRCCFLFGIQLILVTVLLSFLWC